MKKKVDRTPYWIYWDDDSRYWCDKHIRQAVEDFKNEVKKGTARTSEIEYLQKNLDEINLMTDIPYEKHIRCETCGLKLWS